MAPIGKTKFETLSYLPPLNREQLAKEVEHLLRMGWIPCSEFELKDGFVFHENHRSPGYYGRRYCTMWKPPLFGCTDAVHVLNELDEAIKAYLNALIRIIGFDKFVKCNALVSLPKSPLVSKLLINLCNLLT